MRSRFMADKGFQGLGPLRRTRITYHVLLGLVAFVVLFLQVTHPALHPLEVINPDTGTHLACPFSHVAGDLLITLPMPALASLILWLVLEPCSWPGHLYFNHRLAPRPPPTFPL
jgi:hypothetical protein